MKVYLSGAISANPYYKTDFENARKRLNNAGFAVVSPAIFCDESMSFDSRTRKCLKVLSTCHAVAVLVTPYQSARCCLELDVAAVLSMQVKTVDEWIAYAERQRQGLSRRREIQGGTYGTVV